MIERRNADEEENENVPGLSPMNRLLKGLETRVLNVATIGPEPWRR